MVERATGAHLNPAVSLAMASVGRFPIIKVPLYWLAQYLGAFSAAACVLGVYSGTGRNLRLAIFFHWNLSKLRYYHESHPPVAPTQMPSTRKTIL